MNVGTARSGRSCLADFALTSTINDLITIFTRHSEMNIFKNAKILFFVGHQEHNNVSKGKGRPKGRNSCLLF